MVKQFKNFATMSLLLIVVFFTENIFSQKAIKLFENHHKWGIVGELNTFKKGAVTPTGNTNLSFEIFEHKRMSLGLNYNFYQKNNWNYKASLSLQWFGNEGGYSILEPENITPHNVGLFYRTEHDKIAYLPITAEYFFFMKNKFAFSAGLGLGLTFYEFLGKDAFETTIDDVKVFSFEYSSSKNPFYTSGHIEGNIYFKSKYFLLQTSLIYKKSFKSFRTGSYEFINLELSPDVSGTIDQSGDFLGVSLTVYLKKKN